MFPFQSKFDGSKHLDSVIHAMEKTRNERIFDNVCLVYTGLSQKKVSTLENSLHQEYATDLNDSSFS